MKMIKAKLMMEMPIDTRCHQGDGGAKLEKRVTSKGDTNAPRPQVTHRFAVRRKATEMLMLP
jgi:hypothetical protein